MDYDKITAKYARKTSQEVLDEKSNKELESVLDEINEAIEVGEMDIIWYDGLMAESIEELENRGFQVKDLLNSNTGECRIIW